MIKKLVIYAASLAIGIILFQVTHQYATAERGYVAYGGELCFLLLPFFVYIIRSFKRPPTTERRQTTNEKD
jgi:hypothetical protein